MKMSPVTSSHIDSIGHDGDTMQVTFKGGRTYTYQDVTREAFKDFQNAKSPGRHLRSMGIRGKRLDNEEVL